MSKTDEQKTEYRRLMGNEAADRQEKLAAERYPVLQRTTNRATRAVVSEREAVALGDWVRRG